MDHENGKDLPGMARTDPERLEQSRQDSSINMQKDQFNSNPPVPGKDCRHPSTIMEAEFGEKLSDYYNMSAKLALNQSDTKSSNAYSVENLIKSGAEDGTLTYSEESLTDDNNMNEPVPMSSKNGVGKRTSIRRPHRRSEIRGLSKRSSESLPIKELSDGGYLNHQVESVENSFYGSESAALINSKTNTVITQREMMDVALLANNKASASADEMGKFSAESMSVQKMPVNSVDNTSYEQTGEVMSVEGNLRNSVKESEQLFANTLNATVNAKSSVASEGSPVFYHENDAITTGPGINEISVELLDGPLWKEFYKSTNEMIVTKDGRRMFPVLKYKINGLSKSEMYTIKLDFIVVNNHRCKFVNGKWITGVYEDNIDQVSNIYQHYDSPNFGSFWMESPVVFSKVKITNKISKDPTKIHINSLFRYRPRLHIYLIDSATRQLTHLLTKEFKITQFIAVTAYQNDSITKLKVVYNPFAKAFLDGKRDMTPSNSDNYVPVMFSENSDTNKRNSDVPLSILPKRTNNMSGNNLMVSYQQQKNFLNENAGYVYNNNAQQFKQPPFPGMLQKEAMPKPNVAFVQQQANANNYNRLYNAPHVNNSHSNAQKPPPPQYYPNKMVPMAPPAHHPNMPHMYHHPINHMPGHMQNHLPNQMNNQQVYPQAGGVNNVMPGKYNVQVSRYYPYQQGYGNYNYQQVPGLNTYVHSGDGAGLQQLQQLQIQQQMYNNNVNGGEFKHGKYHPAPQHMRDLKSMDDDESTLSNKHMRTASGEAESRVGSSSEVCRARLMTGCNVGPGKEPESSLYKSSQHMSLSSNQTENLTSYSYFANELQGYANHHDQTPAMSTTEYTQQNQYHQFEQPPNNVSNNQEQKNSYTTSNRI